MSINGWWTRALWSCRLASLLVVASCLAPAPREEAATPFGPVRAETADLARAVANELVELYPKVQAGLPDAQASPVEVWVQPKLRYWLCRAHPADGMTLFGLGRIHIIEAEGAAAKRRGVLAHELVHLMMDETWKRLPAGVLEGVCDVVAIEQAPEAGPELRGIRLASAVRALADLIFTVGQEYDLPPGVEVTTQASTLFVMGASIEPMEALALNATGFEALPRDTELALRGLGYLVAARAVERHGLQRLRALCIRAEREERPLVPLAWILAAAELDSIAVEDWNALAVSRIGAAELATIVEVYAGPIGDMLASQGALPAIEFKSPDGGTVSVPARQSIGVLGSDVTIAATEVGGLSGRP